VGADSKDDRADTDAVPLLLVHDAADPRRNLAAPAEELPALRVNGLERARVEQIAEDILKGLNAPRFPTNVPVASTTDGNWTARYEAETAPAPRVHTPPGLASTIVDITQPGSAPGLVRPVSDTDAGERRVSTLRLSREAPNGDASVRRKAFAFIGGGAVVLLLVAAFLVVRLRAGGPPRLPDPSGDRPVTAATPETSHVDAVLPAPPAPAVVDSASDVRPPSAATTPASAPPRATSPKRPPTTPRSPPPSPAPVQDDSAPPWERLKRDLQ
jgi:hypothetical protein